MGHNDLFLVHGIFNSDDDSNPVEEICVGYDEQHNLTLLLEHTDYDLPEYNCHTRAVVQSDDAYLLAKRLGVAMTRLPRAVADSVDNGYYQLINPTLGQTRACFHEILQWLTFQKCRFQLVRSYGHCGYSCF